MKDNYFPEFIAFDKIKEKIVNVLEIYQFRDILVSSEADPSCCYFLEPGEYELLEFTGSLDIKKNKIYDCDILEEDCPRKNKYRVFRVEGGFAINTFQDEFDNPVHYEPLNDMQNAAFVRSGLIRIKNSFEK